jgi:putative acetyltransferase
MNSAELQLVQAHAGPNLAVARELFAEYGRSLPNHICLQDFSRELAELPGEYAPPAGILLLAFSGDVAAGCVALRKIGKIICEMKRLYVRPVFRRQSIGRVLAQNVIDAARQGGYFRLRLDTLSTMKAAHALYESLGFRGTTPYHQSSDDVIFMELDLRQRPGRGRLVPARYGANAKLRGRAVPGLDSQMGRP